MYRRFHCGTNNLPAKHGAKIFGNVLLAKEMIDQVLFASWDYKL